MWNVVLGALFLLALAGCNYRREKGDDRLQPGGTWFVRIQRGVLGPNCMRCHAGPMAAKGIDFSDYRKVMASGTVVPFKPLQSGVLTSILNNRMPKDKPGSVSPEAVAQLRKWIEAGAPELDQVVTPPPPVIPEPNFRWLNANIFQRRCAECHRPPEPKGDVDMTSYRSLMASYGKIFKAVDEGFAETSGVYDQTKTQQMPPEEREKLTPAEVKAVGDWIDAGAKEEE